MTDREIADHLRGATAAKVIEGWYHTGPWPIHPWVVHAKGAGSRQMKRQDIIEYVEMLKLAGVEPRRIKWPS